MKLLLQFQTPYSYHTFYETEDDIIKKRENYQNVDVYNGQFVSLFKTHKRNDLYSEIRKINFLYPSMSKKTRYVTFLYNVGKHHLVYSYFLQYSVLVEGEDFIFDYTDKNIKLLEKL